jgi:molecular chaperone GrpE
MGKRKRQAQEEQSEERVGPVAGEADARDVEEPTETDSAEPGAAEFGPEEASASDQTEAEQPDGVVTALRAELDALNDRYLRLAAEFDNFRKRTLRERTELRERAQADLARQLLETLDDLGRVTALEASNASVHDVIEGIHMVERKLLQELEQAGFERVGVQGEPFDPNHHEAVATHPASEREAPGTIGNVLQPGYRLGSVLLRPARVVVLVDAEPDEE